MKAALKEAEKAFEAGEVPVGAVLVLDGKIIARSHNQVESLQDATAHAEMLVLTMGSSYLSNWRLLKTTLYCTLEPCVMCAGAMMLSRVQRLVWGAKDIRHGACGSFLNIFEKPHPTHSLHIDSGILEQESAALMQQFFRQRREQ
jgi:tRNA(adenine34) deaminase